MNMDVSVRQRDDGLVDLFLTLTMPETMVGGIINDLLASTGKTPDKIKKEPSQTRVLVNPKAENTTCEKLKRVHVDWASRIKEALRARNDEISQSDLVKQLTGHSDHTSCRIEILALVKVGLVLSRKDVLGGHRVNMLKWNPAPSLTPLGATANKIMNYLREHHGPILQSDLCETIIGYRNDSEFNDTMHRLALASLVTVTKGPRRSNVVAISNNNSGVASTPLDILILRRLQGSPRMLNNLVGDLESETVPQKEVEQVVETLLKAGFVEANKQGRLYITDKGQRRVKET